MDQRLAGQTALVTGGGSGIGREIALALARSGAAVAIAGRGAERLHAVADEIRKQGGRALPLPADLRERQAAADLAAAVLREWNQIDILVHNAAAFARGAVVDLDPQAWDDVLATNLTGPFLLTRAALPGMIRRRRGSIVFVSSTSGKRGDAGMAAYSASKFGLMGLAHSLLYEVRPHDIRVVVVSPSAIDTRSQVPAADAVRGVHPHAADVAATVLHCLEQPPRVMIREVEIWGTNP
jgi:3-oxoacyl-[acyl-carrier protein] reductase